MQPNQNQNQQPQPQKQPVSGMVRCRVVSGKFLKAHGADEDGEDQFYAVGDIVEVSRKYYDKLAESRKFDTYEDANGGTTLMPRTVCDMPLELLDKAG